ncbi:GNAT family N-acetyltransferase [Sphingomonas sp. RIT328]|uniref:GNAT family N-acetyltransferase n=1 Tax=Sphingomonas sp. RIT328 TaxID=1470591 RepID=UPI0004533860|nr:GNAT family N-acetyltransferase [Sphingomonas sp. RIT328]EZP52943.1 putative acetyltransferase [Sphingomonas sp. RIT328]
MSDTPTLATPRLTLRCLAPDDAAALFPAMADPAVMRWWSRGPFVDEAELRRYFADRAAEVRYWAVTDARGVIGFVFAAERRSGVSEIGYLIGPAHWGRGVAREAVSAVITHLFASGTRRIFADVDPDAQASARLLERLGFVCEGRLREEWQTHIGIRDTLLYALLAREWRG